MKLKLSGALLILTALVGFNAGCSKAPAEAASQTQATTQTQADVTSPSQSAPVQAEAPAAAAKTPVASSNAAASVAGEYVGDFDGASAAVTISGSPPRYNVHLIIGSDGCGGGALGPARVDSAGVLTVRPTDDASCTITMTPTASGFSVQEHQCSNLHGDTCAFSGQLHHAH